MDWKVTAKSENEAEILHFDVIGDWTPDGWQTARNFIGKVRELGDVRNITLRINSVGGDVFEVQAIYSYLKTHSAKITVRIDGLAASAASMVAMVGDEIIMPENALMMIHNPSTVAWGEASEMRETADFLDKVRDTIAAVYEARTGLDREKIVAMMDDVTWMTAGEAKVLGFCDATDDPIEIAACANNGGNEKITWKTAAGSTQIPKALALKIPASMKGISWEFPGVAAAQNEPQNKQTTEGVEALDIKNVTALQEAFPDLVAEIRKTAEDEAYQRGVADERERLKTLDELKAPGRETVIDKAKYEEPKGVNDVALELLRADRTQAALDDRADDAAALNHVAQPGVSTETKAKQEDAMIDAVADVINEKRGYAK